VENCDANAGFVVASVGKVDEPLRWFVGYAAQRNQIIVSYMDVDPQDLYVGGKVRSFSWLVAYML
jgi:hypothetical protein